MLCVTGLERRVEALAARLERHPTRLHEIRLDALAPFDEAALELVTRAAAVVACRPERQGGGYRGDERKRLELLARAARAGARYVDIEADVPESELGAIAQDQRVLSWHDFSGTGGALGARVRAMSERRPAVVKLAVRVADPSELGDLLELRGAIDTDAVLIGMGRAGQLSRTRYPAFGSRWSYVTASEPTAPGQLTLDEAMALGLPAAAGAPFFALVGGESVAESPGTRIYNARFRRRGVDSCYLAVPCRSLPETLPLLERLGGVGLSVTMPHKLAALAVGEPDALARRVGAVNSLKLEDGRWKGRNTDVAGVRDPLARVLDASSKRALVLGGGGAARAALEACRQLELETWVSARRPEQAVLLGADRTVAWDERARTPCDVLINATAVAGSASPWPDETPLPRVVFDLAMGGRRLLEQAAGRVILNAMDMWLAQGAEQMTWLTGEPFTVRELQRELERWP